MGIEVLAQNVFGQKSDAYRESTMNRSRRDQRTGSRKVVPGRTGELGAMKRHFQLPANGSNPPAVDEMAVGDASYRPFRERESM